METLKVTCGSPELIRRLQKDVLLLLREYEKNASDGAKKRAASFAANRVRILPGEK